MFGFGFSEFLLLAAVVVLFFYARRLPDLARALMKSSKSFREGLHSGDERPVRDVEPLTKDSTEHRRK